MAKKKEVEIKHTEVKSEQPKQDLAQKEISKKHVMRLNVMHDHKTFLKGEDAPKDLLDLFKQRGFVEEI